MKKMMLIMICAFLSVLPALAQEAAPTWKRNTAITLFSAVGGGVLGLSTLSFYGSPQDHTSNVTTGVLLGLCAGIGYVVWEKSHPEATPAWGIDLFEGRPVLAYRKNF